MTREEIFEGLKEVFATVKPNMDFAQVTPKSVLVTDLGVDSLSMLLLALAVENKFGIQLDTNAQFKTVDDVIDAVTALV